MRVYRVDVSRLDAATKQRVYNQVFGWGVVTKERCDDNMVFVAIDVYWDSNTDFNSLFQFPYNCSVADITAQVLL